MSNLQMSDITLKSVNIEAGNFSVLESKDELITTAVINLIASDSRRTSIVNLCLSNLHIMIVNT